MFVMRRFLLRGLLGAIGTLLAITLFLVIQLQLGNFHAVIPGELYRSAQPTATDIAAYTKEHGIKTILNLRGSNPGDKWYRDEVEASKAAGITHLDFRMKGARELTDEQVHALIEVMKTAPKPLLIHCRAGADRSGLAVALYLSELKQSHSREARYQLSLRYGHLPFWWTKAQAMDRTLDRVIP